MVGSIEDSSFLLGSGLVGINGDQFTVDQLAVLSARSQTDRMLLLRMLSLLEKRPINQLIDESIDMDQVNLAKLLSDQPKFTP